MDQHEGGPGHRSDPGGEASAALPDLRRALEAIPGCLGTEAAKTESGKEVIFAWFEDKRAVLRWYQLGASSADDERCVPRLRTARASQGRAGRCRSDPR